MTVEDALRGVTLLGMDTAAFIYFVERNPTYVARCREVFRKVHQGDIIAYSSVLTLTETLTLPLRNADTVLASDYRDMLLNTPGVVSLPLDTAIADQAADLRARYGLKTPDAIQIATAIHMGCQAFLTNDRGHQRVTELSILVLDDLTL